MAKLTRDDLLAKTFVDPANYPYGFSRSGDFSINEAKALQQYGSLISALLSVYCFTLHCCFKPTDFNVNKSTCCSDNV